jgi:hypothetical protein
MAVPSPERPSASAGESPVSSDSSASAARDSRTAPHASIETTDLGIAPEMRHQSAYVWLIFFSSLDIMLTWAILRRGGEEVNPIARQVIDMWGLHGAIVFKFALMLFVIVACEVISRKREHVGRRLSWVAVGISAFPVVYSFGLLIDHILLRPPPMQ